jgi:NAD(P)-dependent dehydrogenase (short-subunit alcohol dehydrogenase family)
MLESTGYPPLLNVASLEGRSAIITGASSGIGLATSKLFIDAGARVHAVARRKEAMVEGVGKERVSSGNFVPHAISVSDRDAVGKMVDEIGERDGVDILVLAAGTNISCRRLEQLPPKAWDEILTVNLSGAFYFILATLPYLRAARGDAVLISSISGTWPDMSGPAYQASKAGMTQLARAAGFEEHQRGVRFSSILPGMVDTPILDNRPDPPPKEMRNLSLKPEDVAAACFFLVTLPPRVYIPELTIMSTALQALGKSSMASLPGLEAHINAPNYKTS